MGFRGVKLLNPCFRREHGASGHPDREVSNDISDTQYRTLRREHADAARAGLSMNVFLIDTQSILTNRLYQIYFIIYQ